MAFQTITLGTARALLAAFGLLAVSGAGLARGVATRGIQVVTIRDDTSFAGTVARLSEPAGYFDSDNLISNETSYLHAVSHLRAIGVASPRATKLAPGVPAIAETVPGFEAQSWNGLVVRAGTSADIIEKLARDFNNAVRDPDIVRQLTESGSEAVGTSPQDFAQFMKTDREKWERVGNRIAGSTVPK